MQETNKYASICSHDFQKSLTNQIILVCIDREGYTHKVSQLGKICNKCTQIIKDSIVRGTRCIVCADTLENYLKERELCSHEDRNVDQVTVRCINSKSKASKAEITHEIPLKNQVCRRCVDQIKAAFMNSNCCKVCEGKEQEIIHDLSKVFVSPTLGHLKNIVEVLNDHKCSAEIIRQEIQSICKAEPRKQAPKDSIIPMQLIDEFEANDRPQFHDSKRYSLFPKCPKHREISLNVCNLCLVALLNLQFCLYGCEKQQQVHKVKKDNTSKTQSTGFLNVYPQTSKNDYVLEMFVVQQVEEKGRLDRWEIFLKKLQPASELEISYKDMYPLYGVVVPISSRTYLVSGGVIGRHVDNMKATNACFMLLLSHDLKQFNIKAVPSMLSPRASHASAYHMERKMVFAIGGFVRGGSFLRTAEVYSQQSVQWYKLGDLKVQRSKPACIIFKGNTYVFGGLTNNPQITECIAERLNYNTNQWQILNYKGWDFPFLCGSVASTSISSLQQKDNVLIFGGSNGQQYSSIIHSLEIDQEGFALSQKANFSKMQNPRSNCVLGMIGEDIILCFGGLYEYESILSIDAVNVRVTDKSISPVFVYDGIEIGSYRLLLRQGSQKVYAKIYDHMLGTRLMSEEKLEGGAASLTSPFNAQTLQKMWYSLGKSFVWVPIGIPEQK